MKAAALVAKSFQKDWEYFWDQGCLILEVRLKNLYKGQEHKGTQMIIIHFVIIIAHALFNSDD